MINPNLLCPHCMNVRTYAYMPCPRCGYHPTAVSHSPRCLRPQTILRNRYMIGTVIGQGGFGITYRGFDLVDNRMVAIKEYFPNGLAMRDTSRYKNTVTSIDGTMTVHFQNGLEKYENEARCLMGLQGTPGVVTILDFFRENATAYIVMEFLEGPTLRQYLEQRNGVMSETEVLRLFRPILESLSVVHKMGIIHRDISPDNIILQPGGMPKLIDFGAARQSTGQATQSLTVILKHGYAPQEQYSSRAKQGPYTDIYAISATMYKCLTGITPVDALSRRLEEDLQPLSALNLGLSSKICAAVEQGMAIMPADRFQSADALLNALFAVQSPLPAPAKPKKSGLLLWIVGILALLGLTLGIGMLIGQSRLREDPPKAEEIQKESAVTEEEQEELLIPTEQPPSEDPSRWPVMTTNRYYNIDTFDEYPYTLGTEVYRRDTIRSITFVNSLEEANETAWDVSYDGDWSVQAWVVPDGAYYDMYIGGEGGVKAPVYSGQLFAGYPALETITFSGNFNTSDVDDMWAMFDSCPSLTTIDIGDWDVSSVTDMFVMFDDCASLEMLDLSGWNTPMIKDTSWMFDGCTSLTEVDLSGWDVSLLEDTSNMFDDCNQLKVLNLTGWSPEAVEMVLPSVSEDTVIIH